MSSIDYDQLARDLVVYLRGGFSQREYSDVLGYSFNQVGKWESGHTQVKWNDFCHMLELKGINVEQIVSEYDQLNNGKLHYQDQILQIISQTLYLDEIRDYDVSAKIQRYQKSRVKKFDLSIILELIDFRQHMLTYWLSAFIDCTKIELLKDSWFHYVSRLDAIGDNPMIPCVRAALELDSYQKLPEHSDEFVSIQSGATLEEVKKCLEVMFDHSEIIKENGLFKIIGPGYSFSHSANPRLRNFHKRVLELASSKYPVNRVDWDFSFLKNATHGSTLVCPASEKASQEITKLLTEYHGKIVEILRKDHVEDKHLEKNNVQVIVRHSFSPSVLNHEQKKDLGALNNLSV